MKLNKRSFSRFRYKFQRRLNLWKATCASREMQEKKLPRDTVEPEHNLV